MAEDYFDAKLALDGNNNPVPSAIASVYAFTDVMFTTPLAITDVQDIPVANLIASPTGIYPAFKVASGETKVLAKSGPMVTPLTSVEGMKGDPGEKGDPGNGVDTSASAQGQVLTSVGPGLAPVWAPGGGTPSWDSVVGKPSAFNPSDHSQPAATISDSTPTGRNLLTAADAQAARAAIGAGTGNGTSNLTLGSTSTTAMPGNRVFRAGEVTVTPTGAITATDMQTAVAQIGTALQSGGSGGSGGVYPWRYSAGGWPTLPATKPAGYFMVQALGPSYPPQASIPSWAGLGSTQLPISYSKVAVQ